MDFVARTPKQLGAVLKSCRSQRRLTQREAGARVGLKQGTVSHIETDATHARIESLYRLMSSLGLELVLREKKPGLAVGRGSSEW
jgi:HTH-type transcriptional regulator/antitoxin HipB